MLLDFVHLTFEVWQMLLKCSDQERRVYMSLYYQSNVYTCETHLLKAADIAKYAEIKDKSAIHKNLRLLIEKKMIAKVPCKSGYKKYRFLHHTKKDWKPKSDIDWLA